MSSDLESNLLQNNFKEVKRSDSEVYEFEEFCLTAAHLMLYRNGEAISLTPKQVETLLALVERNGEIVSKENLMERLWANASVEESNLNQNIYILRKILGETADGLPMIETLRRRGYRFNGKIKQNALPEPEIESAPAAPESGSQAGSPPKNLEDDKTAAEKTEAVNRVGRKRLIVALACTASMITAIALGFYYYFSAKSRVGGDKTSIAVLPINPVNAASRDDLYEIGIAETLIYRLSSSKDLFVRPLNATRQYTDLKQDPLAAGREQRVDYVLASNYQLVNGKIRVTARLINVTTELVEETFKSENAAGDLFKMQDAIAYELGNKLSARFSITLASPSSERGTINEEAYRLYLQGKNLTARQYPTDSLKAVEYFERAIQLDPNFARAYAAMARAYVNLGISGAGLPRVENEKAKEALKKALEIDDNLAEAHAVSGKLKVNDEWNLVEGKKDLLRAIELEPNNDSAHWFYAESLAYSGHFDEAIAEIETALEINPNSLPLQRDRGRILFYARRYDEAIVQLKRVVELDENFEPTWGYLFLSYEMKGDEAHAYEAFLKFQKRMTKRIEIYRKDYETAGWRAVRRKLLEFSKLDEKAPGSNLFAIARQCALLGKKNEAFEYLNKAFEKHQMQMVMLKVEPSLDSLRDDPRFDELVKRVGL